MSGRLSATDSSCQQKPADGGYFASLAPARYMLVTTFRQAGPYVSVPVRGLADGDRAYFRAWSRSGTARRLQHTGAVQVAPCTVLGLYSYGPPLDATARLVTGEEASRVARQLAGKYPARRRFLTRLLHRAWRRRMVHYEVLPYDAADGHAGQ